MNGKSLLAVFVYLLCSLGRNAEAEIPHGEKVYAPDKALAATYLGSQIQISKANNELVGTVRVFPVESLRWTADSRAVVTVEHIAGGSEAVLISYRGDSWKRNELDPPGGPYDAYQVINVDTNGTNVLICYKMRRRSGKEYKYFIASLEINAQAADKGKTIIREIPRSEFERLGSTLAAVRRAQNGSRACQ